MLKGWVKLERLPLPCGCAKLRLGLGSSLPLRVGLPVECMRRFRLEEEERRKHGVRNGPSLGSDFLTSAKLITLGPLGCILQWLGTGYRVSLR